MGFRSGFPIVYARDLPAALGFYRDLLGFAEVHRQPEDMPWGERLASLVDPDGNAVSIAAKV